MTGFQGTTSTDRFIQQSANYITTNSKLKYPRYISIWKISSLPDNILRIYNANYATYSKIV